jgi:hypothetical protein
MRANVGVTRPASIIWEGHKAGRHVGYCHIEKLHNLEPLPSTGFSVCCFPTKIERIGWLDARHRYSRNLKRLKSRGSFWDFDGSGSTRCQKSLKTMLSKKADALRVLVTNHRLLAEAIHRNRVRTRPSARARVWPIAHVGE